MYLLQCQQRALILRFAKDLHRNSRVCLIRFEASDATLPQQHCEMRLENFKLSSTVQNIQKIPWRNWQTKLMKMKLLKWNFFCFAFIWNGKWKPNWIYEFSSRSCFFLSSWQQTQIDIHLESLEKWMRKSKAEGEELPCKLYL